MLRATWSPTCTTSSRRSKHWPTSGPQLDTALAFAVTYPYSQNYIDRAVRGDYVNMFLVADLTVPRLKRTLFLGTRWGGDENAKLIPAPGGIRGI